MSTGVYGIYINPANQWCFHGSVPDLDISGGNVIPNSWQQMIAIQDAATKTRTLYLNGVLVARGYPQDANGTGRL